MKRFSRSPLSTVSSVTEPAEILVATFLVDGLRIEGTDFQFMIHSYNDYSFKGKFQFPVFMNGGKKDFSGFSCNNYPILRMSSVSYN